jgi:methyl-accepting chemotaxis protein WspA
MGAIAYDRFLIVGREAGSIQRDAVPGLSLGLQLMNAWANEYSLLQAHILENDPTAITAAGHGLLRNHALLISLMLRCQGVMSQAQAQREFAAIQSLSAQYMATEASIVTLSVANKDDQARDVMTNQLQPIFQRIQFSVQSVVELNKSNENNSTKQIVSAVTAAEISIFISFIVAAILANAFSYFYSVLSLCHWLISFPLWRCCVRAISAGEYLRRERVSWLRSGPPRGVFRIGGRWVQAR